MFKPHFYLERRDEEVIVSVVPNQSFKLLEVEELDLTSSQKETELHIYIHYENSESLLQKEIVTKYIIPEDSSYLKLVASWKSYKEKPAKRELVIIFNPSDH